MAQVTEPRSPSAAQPNIQDVFLNYARREKMSVSIHLMDGRQFDARQRCGGNDANCKCRRRIGGLDRRRLGVWCRCA